jgi:hypothetical protein
LARSRSVGVRSSVCSQVRSAPSVTTAATHLFPEPGALEQVVDRTVDWLGRWLAPSATG